MSELGQSRNHYSRLRRFSSMLDLVVFDQDAEAMKDLGATFQRISQSKFEIMEELVLLSVATYSIGLCPKDLRRLANELIASNVSEQSSGVLARLSSALHDESLLSLNRLRSGH